MKLTEYINEIGYKKFAETFNINRTTAWKISKKKVCINIRTARKVVKSTAGLVTYDDCFEEFFEQRDSVEKVLLQKTK